MIQLAEGRGRNPVSHLTRRQQSIYDFIVQHLHAQGMPPTLMEIAAAFDLRSPAGVADHLKAIERKGYIRRRPGVSRGIEVRSPEMAAQRPRARAVPVIGAAPGGGGVERARARRISLDAAWAGSDAVAFEAGTDDLDGHGIRRGDLLVADPAQQVRAGDLVIGRQGNSVAILEVDASGLSATPVAGAIDPSADVRGYGRVTTIIRLPNGGTRRSRRR